MNKPSHEYCKDCKDWNGSIVNCMEICSIPINIIEEWEKYHAIGTPDECREAMKIANNQGNTRTNNDVIAEYVKERCPELIETTDFKLYSLGMACKRTEDNFKEAIKKDFSQLLKAFDHLEEKK